MQMLAGVLGRSADGTPTASADHRMAALKRT
jgi:hypothetical protein